MGYSKHLLEVQYRMHPCISKFPNANFYDHRISDGPIVKQETYVKSYLPGPIFGSYSFIHIENDMEMLDSLGRVPRIWLRLLERPDLQKVSFKASAFT